MPEDAPLVRPELLDVVRPEHLVIAAPAETEGGADAVARGAGRTDAVHGRHVVAGLWAQVQAGPGLSGHVGYVDVGRQAEGDVGDVPVIPRKYRINIQQLSVHHYSVSHSYWDSPLHRHLQLCSLDIERMREIELALVFSEGEGDL